MKRVRLIEVDKDDLTPKQRKFAQEYLVDLNSTRAAKRAGYSAKSAHVQGHHELRNPKVAAYIEKQQAKLARRTEVSAERVVNKLAEIAFGETDPELPKPADQLNALAQLGKHLGLFVERHEVDGRMSVLNVSVSAQDLADAKALVENFRAEPKLIEGEVTKDDDVANDDAAK